MGFKEKLLNGELKIYPVEDIYRVYGKTFDDRDEIKKLGGFWNNNKKAFEFSKDSFSNFEPELREKILNLILQDRVNSVKNIENSIINGDIKLYLKDDNYRVYGKTKAISKDLINSGFHFVDGNYQMSASTLSATFKEEVKKKIDFVNEQPQIDEEMECE